VTLDEFLDKIEGVRPAGNGYVGVCPGHDDDAASLGITEGDDGRILLQCYAGCETKHIVETMGLHLRDLFAGRRQLILYHVMFAPGVEGWPTAGCDGCSFFVDSVSHLAHLHARDTSFVLVSRAPLANIEP